MRFRYYGLSAAHVFGGVIRNLDKHCTLANSKISIKDGIKVNLIAHPNIHTGSAYF